MQKNQNNSNKLQFVLNRAQLVESIGILTRDFWGEWNFLIPLFRGLLEKLKIQFPYPHPLPFGRHLEKRGDFFLSVYFVNGQFLQKNIRYLFCREKYGLHFFS